MKTVSTVLVSLFLLCLFCSNASAQTPPKLWDKAIGGNDFDILSVVYPLADGNYLLGGSSHSPVSGDKSEPAYESTYGDSWLVKMDPSGNKIWDKRFGGSGGEYIAAITATSDGGFLLLGSSWSPVSGDKTQGSRGGNDFWLIKIDALGNKVWDKTYGGSSDDEGYTVVPTADGNFLLGGISRSGISGEKTKADFGSIDYWIIKIDPAGNKLWDNAYGGIWEDDLRHVIPVADGYLLAGYSNSPVTGNKTLPSNGGRDYWMVKVDLSGAKQWEKVYGGNTEDIFTSYVATTDGYLLGGYSLSPVSGDKSESNKGAEDYWIVKINSTGVKSWDKTLGGTGVDELRSIQLHPAGGFMIGGSSRSGITGDKTQANRGWEDYWMIRTDDNGSKIWDLTVGGTDEDELRSMHATPDGGWMVAGFSWSGAGGDKSAPSKGSRDYWMVRLGAPASVNITAVSSMNLCAGANASVTYAAAGTFNAGNVFTAQLSDNTGSFSSAINIGSVTSTASGSIPVTIPSGVFQGSNYRIRVVASSPVITSADNGTNITINRPPVMNSIANETACNNATVTLPAFQSSTAGTTYNWTSSNSSVGLPASGTGDLPSFTAVNAGNTPASATITVTPDLNGCAGSPVSFTLTVNPTPVVSAISDQILCNNATTAAISFAANVSGTVYTWTNTQTSIGLGATGSSNIPSFTATNTGNTAVAATISVTPSANGCTGAAKNFTITVKPTPSVSAVGNVIACHGESLAAINFNGSVSGTVYNWTNNNNTIGLASSGSGNIGAFTATNNGTSPLVSTVSVTPVADGCTGTVGSFTITVNPATKITTQPTGQTVCANTPATFTVVATGTGTLSYQWKKGGTNIAGANSSSYTIASATAADAGAYTVDVTGSCGTVASNTATLVVNTATGCTTSLPVIDASVASSSLMPNLVTGETLLRVQVKRTMKIEWTLTDMTGRVLRRFTQQANAGHANEMRLNVAALGKGMYQLTGHTGNGVIRLKFVRM